MLVAGGLVRRQRRAWVAGSSRGEQADRGHPGPSLPAYQPPGNEHLAQPGQRLDRRCPGAERKGDSEEQSGQRSIGTYVEGGEQGDEASNAHQAADQAGDSGRSGALPGLLSGLAGRNHASQGYREGLLPGPQFGGGIVKVGR